MFSNDSNLVITKDDLSGIISDKWHDGEGEIELNILKIPPNVHALGCFWREISKSSLLQLG